LKNQYEAMFVFDPSFAGDFQKAEDEIRRLMERADAEMVFCRKWDERKLAYEIRGRKRGVYVLVYFRAAPEMIAPLERDAQIRDPILRLLVLRADGVTPETMNEFAPPKERARPEPEAEAPTRAQDAAEGESASRAPQEAPMAAAKAVESDTDASSESNPAD
jgi:small subunit ribosomal protein S6